MKNDIWKNQFQSFDYKILKGGCDATFLLSFLSLLEQTDDSPKIPQIAANFGCPHPPL
jgi:hypothetical protein